MPYRKDPKIDTPPGDTIIWRYMDFTKYVSLLEQRVLFFATIEAMRHVDPFEGRLPIANLSHRRDLYPERFKEKPEAEAERDLKRLWNFVRQVHDAVVPLVAVNCWYMRPHESASMWKLYGDAIAIQSTTKDLIDALVDIPAVNLFGTMSEVPVYIRPVDYSDYYAITRMETDWLLPSLTKCNYFEDEHEMRAVAQLLPGYFGSPELFKFPDGTDIPPLFAELSTLHGFYHRVDINQLIKAVFVSPASSPWTTGLIEKVTRRYGVHAPVAQSKLYVDPTYGDEEELAALPPLEMHTPELLLKDLRAGMSADSKGTS